MTLHPRISTLVTEGNFQAARWIKVQALLEPEELLALIEGLPPFWIVPLSALPTPQVAMSPTEYITPYAPLIDALKKGEVPDVRSLPTVAWTCEPDGVWLQEIAGGRFLARPSQPWIVVQPHQVAYSPVDGEFRSMSLSADSFFWGLQFSFPGVYQEPRTLDFKEAHHGKNGELFHLLRRSVRHATTATSMRVGDKSVHLPIRMGKSCTSWIKHHPQLAPKGLTVAIRHET